MNIIEILDRFEILYKNNTNISDIRRSYIDKDLHSIFRVVEKIKYIEDFKKLVLYDDYHSLWRILEKETNSDFIYGLKKLHDKIGDSFSRGQINSKMWLIDNLKGIELGNVFLCAGWYGTLATMLFENVNIYLKTVKCFDIDDTCREISELINKKWVIDNWKFKASTLDIMEMEFPTKHITYRSDGSSIELYDEPDTIINTSCEHINLPEWFKILPKNKLVVLQTNNFFEHPQHINCVHNLEEFKEQAPLSKILYQGEINLEKYIRYMLIGYV